MWLFPLACSGGTAGPAPACGWSLCPRTLSKALGSLFQALGVHSPTVLGRSMSGASGPRLCPSAQEGSPGALCPAWVASGVASCGCHMGATSGTVSWSLCRAVGPHPCQGTPL